jgi:hypothetical protein
MSFFNIRTRACRELEACCDRLIDNELGHEAEALILRHLPDCPACADLVDEQIRLKTQIRSSVRSFAIPRSLRQNVIARLRLCPN